MKHGTCESKQDEKKRRWEMPAQKKVVQTVLTLEEYSILNEYATKNKLSIKDVVKIALKNFLLDETIDPKDKFFSIKVKSKMQEDKGSEEVDEIVYSS